MTGPQSVPDAPPASIPDAAALAEAVALAMQFGIPAGLFPGRGETPSSPTDNGIPRPDSAVGPGLLPASADAAPPGGPVSSAELTASVGDSGTAGPRGFWFNVNAELIVYGATAPDARLTVDGQPMALRPDGTFTLRFALPDGSYGLELQATAADANEDRTARLRFLRGTRTGGRVGIQPPAQDLPSPPEA
ncbi:MAG: hypothetical protein H7A46_23085 [Verrucomicrobiales bacterium]|nr:hypothetical protein [Verrucomicrobiales bacterium]